MEEKKVVTLDTEVNVEKKSLREKTKEWWDQKGKKIVVTTGKAVGGAVLLIGCAFIGMALAENAKQSDDDGNSDSEDTIDNVPFEVSNEVPVEAE